MRGETRRWVAFAVGAILGLPAVASLLVILAVPPFSGWMPPLAAALWPAAALVFQALALLPPESVLGQLFYGTFEPLPQWFGTGALAAHAALLGLPWAVVAVLAARWVARAPQPA